MSVDIERTRKRLCEHAGKYYPEFARGDVRLRQLPFCEASTYPLCLFEISNDAGSRKAVVKFAPVFPENNEGKTEFDNMRRLWASAASAADAAVAGLGFVRALDFYEDTNALVMEYVDATRFSDWLLRAAAFWAPKDLADALPSYAYLAGRWLALFHRSTMAEPAANVADGRFYENYNERLRRFDEMGLHTRSLPMLTEFGNTIGPTLARLPGPQALIHGDYGPQNMAIAENKLYVFDLQRKFNEVVYHDVAYFQVTLRTLNPYPKSPLFNRRRAVMLEADFLRGYFGRELTPPEQASHQLFLFANLLQRQIKQYTNLTQRGIPALAVRRILELRYSRAIRRELRATVAAASRV